MLRTGAKLQPVQTTYLYNSIKMKDNNVKEVYQMIEPRSNIEAVLKNKWDQEIRIPSDLIRNQLQSGHTSTSTATQSYQDVVLS